MTAGFCQLTLTVARASAEGAASFTTIFEPAEDGQSQTTDGLEESDALQPRHAIDHVVKKSPITTFNRRVPPGFCPAMALMTGKNATDIGQNAKAVWYRRMVPRRRWRGVYMNIISMLLMERSAMWTPICFSLNPSPPDLTGVNANKGYLRQMLNAC